MRPYVLLSCAISIDGYIDDASDRRLRLSSEADFDRVDEVRAGCDAILVGAGTIRADNPALMVRSQARRDARVARGLSPNPARVTLTSSGDLDPAARFFAAGNAGKIVYVAGGAAAQIRAALGGSADVVEVGDPVDLRRLLADLSSRGIARLMVEGGGSVHTQFLTAELADELQLAVAPLFIGDSRAPRFVGNGSFAWNPGHRARLAEVRASGDMALLRFALSDRFATG